MGKEERDFSTTPNNVGGQRAKSRSSVVLCQLLNTYSARGTFRSQHFPLLEVPEFFIRSQSIVEKSSSLFCLVPRKAVLTRLKKILDSIIDSMVKKAWELKKSFRHQKVPLTSILSLIL